MRQATSGPTPGFSMIKIILYFDGYRQISIFLEHLTGQCVLGNYLSHKSNITFHFVELLHTHIVWLQEFEFSLHFVHLWPQ